MAPEKEVGSPVDQPLHDRVAVYRVLAEENDRLVRPEREHRLRKRLDLLLNGGRRIVPVIDIVQDDDVRPKVLFL